MYTLVIDATFKADKKPEFLNYWKSEIFPTLQEQNGFVDEILLFADKDPNQGMGLSFWDNKQDAENYYRNVFPRLASAVEPFCERRPVAREYNVEIAESFDVSGEEAA
jgi:heme-degrading monooxygenase HmoA